MLKNNKRFLPKLIKYKKYSEKGGYLIPFENVKKRIVLGNNCPIKIKRIFFAGVQLIFMGLLGEYIGKILKNVNKEPQYSIDYIKLNEPKK
jgi:hypothetical protein